MKMQTSLLLLLLPLVAFADVYMHNPRGANDRGCETNNNRNNGNRLWDSQNNDKGGYACPHAFPFDCYKYDSEEDEELYEECNARNSEENYDDISELGLMDDGGVLAENGTRTPKMYFYEGSQLQIEWTAQHGCGENERTHCDMILQYACEDTLTDDCGEPDSGKRCGPRDGLPMTNSNRDRGSLTYTTLLNINDNNNINRRERDRDATERIPFSIDHNCQSDPRFGRHEPISFYRKCRLTERNKGLWIADQNLNGNDATRTRQNPNGNRNGLECPEESEYYPWWSPSPWKDIAILTDRWHLCDWMVRESQNVKEKYECLCSFCDEQRLIPNNEGGCTAIGGQWVMVPAHDIPAPICGPPPTSRENNLGNPIGGGKSASAYNWTLPWYVPAGQTCILRLRYNISTGDVVPSSGLKVTLDGTSAQNAGNSPLHDRDGAGSEAKAYRNFVELPAETHPSAKLGVATNTNQFGRTFQDRSWSFEIRRRPRDMPCMNKAIYNLNVRGKRGNIVDVYPNVEYDFIPNELYVTDNDCIHVQWTGSDYNPARNANAAYGGPPDPTNFGAGRTDRTNMVQTYGPNTNYPVESLDYHWNMLYATHEQKVRLAWLDQNIANPEECMSIQDIQAERETNSRLNDQNARDRYHKNCAKLSGQKIPYFDGGLFAPGPIGTYYYMCTRSNSFSNRDMKGTLHVQSQILADGNILYVVLGGSVGGILAMAGILAFRRRANKYNDPEDGAAAGLLLPAGQKRRNSPTDSAPPPVPRRARPGVELGSAAAAPIGGAASANGGVTALYNHASSEAGELEFRKGDIITVLRKDPSGWWEGRTSDGKQGVFPSNYVQQ